MSDERTYTVDEIKRALKGAELPSYMRHKVYSNLPPKAEPKPPNLTTPGQRVRIDGGERSGIVAACSVEDRWRNAQEIRVWTSLHNAESFRYGDGRLTNTGGVITGVE